MSEIQKLQLDVAGMDTAGEFLLDHGEYLVGRDETCAVRLDHPRVQRQHAMLRVTATAATIVDLHRRSRTLRNGALIGLEMPVVLADGDELIIGPFTLRVQLVGIVADEAAAAAPAGPPAADDATQAAPPPALRSAAAINGGSVPPSALLPDYLRTAPPPPPDYSDQHPPGLGRHSIRFIDYLPTIFRTDFGSRYMAIFEALLLPVSWNIENFDFFLDPATAPAPFLDWMAGWFGLKFDGTWSEAQRRQLLSEAHDLLARRGTRQALSRLLEIYTGRAPQIVEEGLPPYTFLVRLPFRERDLNRPLIEQLIESNKPAHTSYQLEFDSRLNVDVIWKKLSFDNE